MNVYYFPGILHTIMFHRALGLVQPKDVDLELFEITYVRFNHDHVTKDVAPIFLSSVLEYMHSYDLYIKI